jgi:predicted RNA-binding Zn-ribbon protein involved in translation (DUF1610 family)
MNDIFSDKMGHEKRDKGIYYTPEYITEYICKKTLLYYLSPDKITHSFRDLIENYHEKPETLEKKLLSLKILDPSCGEGAFLSKMCEILTDLHLRLEYLKKNKKNKNTKKLKLLINKNSFESEYKRNLEKKIFRNNIFGVDLNKSPNVKSAISVKEGNSLISDFSVHDKAFIWDDEFKEIQNNGGFDIIIGNPPWGADLEGMKGYLENEYSHITNGQYDSFGLFLYQNIRDLLKPDGIIGYVLPNELCFIDNYKALRKYLLKYKLLEIINLGFEIFEDVQKSSLIIFIKKRRFRKDSRELVKIATGVNREEKTLLNNMDIALEELIEKRHYFRKQSELKSNKDHIFDIFSNEKDRRIKDIILENNFKPLKDYFLNGRGIDTNKRGIHFICPKCGLLNPPFGRGHSGRINKKLCKAEECSYYFQKSHKKEYKKVKLISENNYPQEGYNAPGYIGEDLHKLHFNRKPRAFKYFGDKFNNNSNNRGKFKKYSEISWGKDKLYYGEKLLIRKVSTGHNLQIMVSDDYLITNQQIYIFKKKKDYDRISILYFLGILISRLIHYYYIKEFGDPEKKILPHFTQSKLKILPIPMPDLDSDEYKKTINYVQNLLYLVNKIENHKNKMGEDNQNTNYHSYELPMKNLMERIQKNYGKLDEIILNIYNINKKDLRDRIINESNKYQFEMY